MQTIDDQPSPARLEPTFLERLFESAGLAIFACDLGGRAITWNAPADRLLRERSVRGVRPLVREILDESDRPGLDEHLRTVRDTLEAAEFRVRLVRRSEPFEYALWIVPIFDEQGALEGVSVWFHDITARVQLRKSTRKRERLTALGALSGAVSHHYNNLLCSIATSLEYAMNMNTMSAMRRALGRTMDAVTRATVLTRQLLAFAQADHRATDLADLTETVLYFFDEHEPALARQNIRLELRWETIPILPVPREPIEIILHNLVENAVEAMPAGGVLGVHLARKNADSVHLIIADSGAGIAAEAMERLFEPFFTTRGTLDAGVARKAGMGLAVVHGLVSDLHGAIAATNNPAGGARFEITFPIPA